MNLKINQQLTVAFYNHVDTCEDCNGNPTNLCGRGIMLLADALSDNRGPLPPVPLAEFEAEREENSL